MSTIFGKGTDDPLGAVLRCPRCWLFGLLTAYVPGEVAVFDCDARRGGCGTRFRLGLGDGGTLTSERIGEEVAA